MSIEAAPISVVCLAALGGLSLSGLLSKAYRDNWLQHLGLIGILFWSLGRASIIGSRVLEGDWHISFYQLLSHVALLLFAVGTAVKVWKHRP
jgi:hypothetical protein